MNARHNPAGIKIGYKTHHHDHAMTFVSFNTIKTIVNNPPNPIPFDAVDSLLMCFYFCF